MIWMLVAHLAGPLPAITIYIASPYKTQAACTSAAVDLRASTPGIVASCVSHWTEDRKMALQPR
jgi:hypothetical protein